MNPRLALTHPYPFERLRALLADARPGPHPAVSLALGEPRHAPPEEIVRALCEPRTLAADLGSYPPTRGSDALRQAIAAWTCRRFGLADGAVDPERHVLPVNGTREALFAVAALIVDPGASQLVAMPNPFYQIYEGAALLAGAEPRYLPCTESSGFIPDFGSMNAGDWSRCSLLYICSPGNPSGAIMPIELLVELIELAERHDFVIAADECYSEVYRQALGPPPGLLQAAASIGNTEFRRCMVFHSLSKRSNLPGLRSGFVAGDAELIARFLHYRTYHGCAMPPATQRASTLAWQDERHVRENRALYDHKYQRVLPLLEPVLGVSQPPAGFYLWPKVDDDDQACARRLFEAANVTVLPGSYLGRPDPARGLPNPGAGRIRMALVAEPDTCEAAARRLATVLGGSRNC